MKICIIGAAGVRTPLMVWALIERGKSLGLTELSLMDIDQPRLDIIANVIKAKPLYQASEISINFTADAQSGLKNADFVITTFRVGGITSRIIDERVALDQAILGQETTGPGGFAMGMRSIPVLMNYLRVMNDVCPEAWLINFANPSGMLAEAVVRSSNWRRVVGICDAPAMMHRTAAAILHAPLDDVFMDYFGLNHLGWVRGLHYRGQDWLPQLLKMLAGSENKLLKIPFASDFLSSLGMIPNEYLFYYYNRVQALNNILKSGQTRGEYIAFLNERLFTDLAREIASNDQDRLLAVYFDYIDKRGETYMYAETGGLQDISKMDSNIVKAVMTGGYAGVALDLIEGLVGARPRVMTLNIPNQFAINGMGPLDVVEIPVYVSRDRVQPCVVGELPEGCFGLIKQVKTYEHLTIEAAINGSYSTAMQALVTHPLVMDYPKAKAILDGYILQHGENFPPLH